MNENEYDVVIVGAGPAGGHCARLLSRSHKVLLVEKAKDFSVNNYSTAGAPLETMEEFSLPTEVVGTHWNRIALWSTQEKVSWEGEDPLGVVFDFQKLRTYLADEVEKQGSTVRLNTLYQKHEQGCSGVRVFLKDRETKEVSIALAKIAIDATGAERMLLPKLPKEQMVRATGIEYLLEVDKQDYQTFARQLSFFLGKKWMPQGYSWIFPMQPNILKIGVGRYFQEEQIVPHNPSYKHYLDFLIKTCLTGKTKILDSHGKTLQYAYHQQGARFDGRVLGIGDAISTVNPLALEGIRHAMRSARFATEQIAPFLKGDKDSFTDYSTRVDKHYGFKWRIAEHLMRCIYRQPDDRKTDCVILAFQKLSLQEMMNFCFHYKTKEALKFYTNYLWCCIRNAWRS